MNYSIAERMRYLDTSSAGVWNPSGQNLAPYENTLIHCGVPANPSEYAVRGATLASDR